MRPEKEIDEVVWEGARKLMIWREKMKAKAEDNELMKKGPLEGTYGRGELNSVSTIEGQAKEEIKRLRGRPKKPDNEKVKVLSFKVSPQIIQKFKDLQIEGGKGIGSKICALLEYYETKSILERERVLKLQGLLREFVRAYTAWRKAQSLNLKKDEPQRFIQIEEMLKEKTLRMNEYYEFLCLRLNEYKRILNGEDFKWLEEYLAYRIKHCF